MQVQLVALTSYVHTCRSLVTRFAHVENTLFEFNDGILDVVGLRRESIG